MTRRNLTLIGIFALSGALIYLACFSITADFHIGPFDQRDMEHFIGFCGLALVLHTLFACAYDWRESWPALLLPVGVTILSWWEFFYSNALVLPDTVRVLADLIRNPGAIYLVGILLGAAAFRNLGCRYSLAFSVFLCLLCSIGWEVIQQPNIAVYHGPARQYIQWSQLIADLLAICAATIFAHKTIRPLSAQVEVALAAA